MKQYAAEWNTRFARLAKDQFKRPRCIAITKRRGELLSAAAVFDGQAEWIMATYHPSAVLRAPDEERRHQMRAELIDDLKGAAARMGG